jgi:hypothetical protein
VPGEEPRGVVFHPGPSDYRQSGALYFLIRNFLLPYYPEAKIGRPFALSHGIDRLEIKPAQVNVIMAVRR